MEDFLYFLSQYPFVAFLIVFFLFRMLFGDNAKAKQKKAEMRAQQARMKEEKRAKVAAANQTQQSRSGDAVAGEGILAQIQRHLEEATRNAENELRGQISSSDQHSLSRPEIRMSGPVEVETSSLESPTREDLFAEPTVRMAAPVTESTIDYDLNSDSFIYHSASEASDTEIQRRSALASPRDAYAFNAASSKPDDVAYSMNRRRYVSAARIDAPQVAIRENDGAAPAVNVRDIFSDSNSLARAFILQEILGPPRGRRSSSSDQVRPR